jgi:carbonic anhydrase
VPARGAILDPRYLEFSQQVLSNNEIGSRGEVIMCMLCANTEHRNVSIARRRFLKLTSAAAAAGLVLSPPAFAAKRATPPKPQNVLSPDAAFDRLMKGNVRYVKGVSRRHDFVHEREPLATGQNPFAGVLSCADSRIAPEYCFDVARGDVFVCRVAGNFASDDVIASFEYAVAVLNTPLILVLGHDACGAIDATIKSLKDGTTLPGHLPALVSALTPAVQAVKDQPGDLLDNAIKRNVAMTMDKLKSASSILGDAVTAKKLRIAGGVYKLRTGKLELLA